MLKTFPYNNEKTYLYEQREKLELELSKALSARRKIFLTRNDKDKAKYERLSKKINEIEKQYLDVIDRIEQVQ